MLNGKELGQAIEKAFKLKKQTGAISSKADIARHFGIKTPSVYDWVKKGSIGKEKLPELFRYFADVVGFEHWGLTKDEWPLGLSEATEAGRALHGQIVTKKAIPIKPKSHHQERVDEIVALLQQTNMEGLAVILDRARDAAREYPLAKKTQKLSP